MKKLFLVGAVALFGAVNAQEYKPGTGDVTTEFGLKGGLSDTKVELPESNAYFKARYFKADNVAYRATLSLGTTSNTKDVDFYTAKGFASETHTTGKDKNSSMSLSLGFGLEKHFKGTERLSPYVGGEFLLGYSSKKESSERTTVNSGSNKTSYRETNNDETKGANGFSFGVRGVFGADYYFTKKVFLGVEAGLGFMYESKGKTTTTSSYSLTTGGTTVSDSRTSTAPGSRSFGFSPSVVTGIRLGYAF